MNNNYPELIVEITGLKNDETFPIKYTHRGEEVSPEFTIKNLSPTEKTIAIIFDDIDLKMNHWIACDIPATNMVAENISKDVSLQNSGNVKQRSKYRGTNLPKGVRHKYQFNIYVLNCELMVKNMSTKKLHKAMDEHIVQYGFVNGYFE